MDSLTQITLGAAFTHSVVFSLVIPLGLGLLVHRLYSGKQAPWPKNKNVSLLAGWFFFFLTVFVGSYLMPLEIKNIGQIAMVASLGMIAAPMVVHPKCPPIIASALALPRI